MYVSYLRQRPAHAGAACVRAGRCLTLFCSLHVYQDIARTRAGGRAVLVLHRPRALVERTGGHGRSGDRVLFSGSGGVLLGRLAAAARIGRGGDVDESRSVGDRCSEKRKTSSLLGGGNEEGESGG